MNKGIRLPSDIVEISNLIEDPSRATILMCLLDGKAILANELARAARIKPPTANPLLDGLVKKGLLILEFHEGRPYYRLDSRRTKQVCDALYSIELPMPIRSRKDSSQSVMLHFARTCYDHLAGKVGVALTDKFLELGLIQDDGWDFLVTPIGLKRLREFGIPLTEIGGKNRHLVHRCMDLSELHPHMAGVLGTTLTKRLLELGWIKRIPGSRAIQVTKTGIQGFKNEFNILLTSAAEELLS